MAQQGDLFGGRADRDEALARVAINSGGWFVAAMQIVMRLPAGWTGTGEDLRVHHVQPVIGEPHKPEAWGSLVSQAKRQGWLACTGERRAMKVRKSHARMTDVYRRVAS